MSRVILVTGCSSGIGLGLARELRRRGERCFASARRAASVEALRAEGLEAVRLDVTDPVSIREAVDAVLAAAGRIDVLVNNAGTSLFGPLVETPLEDVRRMLEANLIGALALVQAVFPGMAARRSGRIVNVGSMVGVVPTPWVGAYSGAKAGLHVLSEALRMELAPFGIDVIVVQPGAVRSQVADNAPRHARTPHYAPIAAHIERRAGASQERPMSAEEFARRVVDALLSADPPRVVQEGGGIGAIRVLQRLPGRLRDRLFRRMFGLEELRALLDAGPR
jgi:NAD(P)-dependent dehydrogenase (short-subunit alcohol dehydrogenase family)